MSDSDWEVLSSDGEGQLAPSQLRPSAGPGLHTSAASSSTLASPPPPLHKRDAQSRADVSPHLPSRRINSGTVLQPLCLTLNQTGTRLGVGHTKGFLVFRVGTATATEEGTLDPPQSRLSLDPQYNVDLLTFSHVRERIRQQQQRHQQQQQQASTHTAPAPVSATHSADSIGSSSDNEGEDAVEDGGNTALVQDDLGSFLTAAGRAFAQMRGKDRHAGGVAKRTSASVTPQRWEADAPSDVQEVDAARQAGTVASSSKANREFAQRSDAEPTDVESRQRRDHPDDGVPPLACEAETDSSRRNVVPAAAAAPASTVQQQQQLPCPVLEWGDEDIEVDPLEGSEHDVPLSSIGDSARARHRAHTSAGAPAQTVQDSDEDYVGFEGGGVAVMSFLYDRTWLALVGGGPTPMGSPNQVCFVRDGERQHSLSLPHPIVRLSLDARLLFVVTTAELRVYTNPLERDWVCARHTINLSPSLASRYASVLLAAPSGTAGKGDKNGETDRSALRMWNRSSPAPIVASSVEQAAAGTSSTASFSCSPSNAHQHSNEMASAKSCVPLPTIPFVVDYARSLFIIPVGETGGGFALYHYVSGPEPVETHVVSTANDPAMGESSTPTFSAALATGRTTVFLEHIATQSVAHQNPLANLALYVGWPAATSRLLTETDATASTAAATDALHKSAAGTGSGEGVRAREEPLPHRTPAHNGPVTLVAASSAYATRLTLWVLQEPTPDSPTASHQDPAMHFIAGGRHTPALGSSFVLLREFRVGVRLNAPKAVMAALPGVSRLMTRGSSSSGSGGQHMSGVSKTDATGASATGTGFSSNASVAGASNSVSGGLFLSSATPSAAAAAGATPGTGSVSSWAAEAAAAVAGASSSATSPCVRHLQFVHNGAYLFCVHGSDAMSIFSTSARETEQEARNVCRDRVAAEQNRYSRLSVMQEYLPRALSTRLHAYTRQAWSSCSGRLPSTDASFVPQWLYLQKQDAAAAAVALQSSQHTTTGTHALQNARDAQLTSTITSTDATIGTDSKGGRRFFQRLTSLVGSRPSPPQPQPASAAKTTLKGVESLQGLESHAQRNDSLSSADSRPTAILPQTTTVGVPQDASPDRRVSESSVGARQGWGTPFTELPDCIRIWSSAPSLSPASSHSLGRQPIVLSCATCDGAFVNVELFAEEGQLMTSRVVQYAAE